jgi:hypothetical protein
MNTNKKVIISIPEPCHQSWENMTEVDNLHRHCSSCDKVLTDFSGMSDTELVLWLKHSKGKMCGRYAPSQLNRAMPVPAEKSEKKKYWLNALWLIPFAWGSKEARAQNTTPEVLRGKPPVSVITSTPQTVVAPAAKVHAAIKVTGTISLPDSLSKAAGAIVTAMVGAQNIQVKADSNGVYTITLPEDTLESVTMWISYAGYMAQYENIARSQAVDGRIVHDVLFERLEPMMVGIIIMDFDPKDIKPENVHPEKKTFWSKVRSGFSSGKGDKNEK